MPSRTRVNRLRVASSRESPAADTSPKRAVHFVCHFPVALSYLIKSSSLMTFLLLEYNSTSADYHQRWQYADHSPCTCKSSMRHHPKTRFHQGQVCRYNLATCHEPGQSRFSFLHRLMLFDDSLVISWALSPHKRRVVPVASLTNIKRSSIVGVSSMPSSQMKANTSDSSNGLPSVAARLTASSK